VYQWQNVQQLPYVSDVLRRRISKQQQAVPRNEDRETETMDVEMLE
jgi:hypothetical protein